MIAMANKSHMVEAPPTPGRPVFSFSTGVGSRKNFPSKWDDAQKWVISSSPAHHHVPSNGSFVVVKQQDNKTVVPTATSVCMDHQLEKPFNGVSPPEPSDVLLKDKLTNAEEDKFSRFRCLVPIKEGFLLKDASTEVVQERDTGTNIGCLTPLSPPRHNTPASMSGPLAFSTSFDIAELQECHLAKLQPVICNWSSREEEEEDVSKSLRHFDQLPKTIPGPTPCAWEQQEDKTKSHLRYQREEAKIQAWVNLQNAKAEAQSRKLEVKIQKMRSKFEEKMMKRMASVHRKAEELRVAAQYEHNMQLRRATTQAKKTKNLHESMHFSGHGGSCTCFPCNPLHL